MALVAENSQQKPLSAVSLVAPVKALMLKYYELNQE
jgi:hypothetical protein